MELWSWKILTAGITGWRSFVFMLIWFIGNAGLFFVGWLEQRNDPALAHLNEPLGWSVFFSRGAGLALAAQVAMIFFPVCRNIIALIMEVKFLRNLIPFEKAIHLHKIIAWTMAAFTAVHVISHCFNFRVVQALGLLGGKRAVVIVWTHPAGISGVVMLVCMFLMYTSALPPVRRQCFELFWYIHHMFLPFMVAYFVHSIGCFVRRKFEDGSHACKPYYSYYMALPGFGIYLLERILREVRSRKDTYIYKIVAHPSNTVELQLVKSSFKAKVGQYVFVNIPSVSKFQWHPYTLTSAPEDNFVSVHLRIVGDWTEAVAKRVGYYNPEAKLGEKDYPVIRIDGPYGTPTQEVFDYERVILIGAGIGVTPFAAILRSIWHRGRDNNKPRRVKKVHFIWVCRDTKSFEWFQELLAELEADTSDQFLQFQLYVTGKMDEDQLANITVHADGAQDAITSLRSATHYGRPNFDRIFQDIVEQTRGSTTGAGKETIGIFFCGPVGLRTVLRNSAKANQTRDVRLKFHAEKF